MGGLGSSAAGDKEHAGRERLLHNRQNRPTRLHAHCVAVLKIPEAPCAPGLVKTTRAVQPSGLLHMLEFESTVGSRCRRFDDVGVSTATSSEG